MLTALFSSLLSKNNPMSPKPDEEFEGSSYRYCFWYLLDSGKEVWKIEKLLNGDLIYPKWGLVDSTERLSVKEMKPNSEKDCLRIIKKLKRLEADLRKARLEKDRKQKALEQKYGGPTIV